MVDFTVVVENPCKVKAPADVDQVEAAPPVSVIAAPLVTPMAPAALLPMVTAPVEVPLLIVVLKFDD